MFSICSVATFFLWHVCCFTFFPFFSFARESSLNNSHQNTICCGDVIALDCVFLCWGGEHAGFCCLVLPRFCKLFLDAVLKDEGCTLPLVFLTEAWCKPATRVLKTPVEWVLASPDKQMERQAVLCFPLLPEPLAELRIVFILITICKVQHYVVIIGGSKGRGTLANWPSQDAAHTSRLDILDYFLPLF